ncbi:MAG: hypothetical protein WBC04_13960 [Candidatus Acidiferrales bacterium]
MSLSFARAQLGEVCFSLLSWMDAGDFFKELQYTKKQGSHYADEFRKDGQIVSVFPEELRVIVVFETASCVRNKEPAVSAERVDDLLRSLELEASWKRGLEYRPAELTGPPTLSGKPTTVGNVVGDSYAFHVHARGVPITDHLVISVFGPDKKFLVRVTFDLTRDLLDLKFPGEF